MSEIPGTPGMVIADRYELQSLIGRGGMGCVWLAQHRSLKTPVAIKLLTPTRAERGLVLARFLREAQAAASLRGANVVHILDHGVDGDVPYIAMEYLEGESLRDRLRRDVKLDAGETARVLTGVVRAIARAHRAGIVHRDLKPDNIFLARDEDAGGEVVKVLDFGIAKVADTAEVDPSAPTISGSLAESTRTGAMLGTPFYMSPEQARGRKDLDARSDLWSLAVIAFECLTGERPFHAEVLGDLMMQICSDPVAAPSTRGDVPAGFDAWFARATERDPARRFQSIREFATELAQILTPGRAWLEPRTDDDDAAPAAGRASVPPVDASSAATPSAGATTGGKGATSLDTPPAAAPGAPGSVRARSRAVVVAAVVAVVACAAIGVIALRRGATSEPAAVASTASAPSTPVDAPSQRPAGAAARASATVAVVRRRLVVLPADATVDVDGARVENVDGEVVVSGRPGSVHSARISKADVSVTRPFVITDEGLSPAKVELPPAPVAPTGPPPKATQPAAAKAPPPRATARDDKPPVPDKFE